MVRRKNQGLFYEKKRGNFAKSFFILFVSLFILIGAVGFVHSASIIDQLHLNLQVTDSSGNVIPGTYNFKFDIATDSSCTNVIYSNSTTLTTDSRGIISYYLPSTSMNFQQQYYLCYYRDGSLINTVPIARAPYAYTAKNVNVSGIIADSNLNLSNYNLSAGYLFGSGKYLTGINASAVNYWGLNGSNLYYNGGNVGIGTGNPGAKLDVNGTVSIGGIISINPTPSTGGMITSSVAGNYIPMIFSNPTGYSHIQINGFQVGGASNSNTEGYVKTADNSRGIFLDSRGISFRSTGSSSPYGVVFSSSGNVGIGTTSPTQALDVNGSAIIRGGLNMNGNVISNLANGSASQDAVTYSQLQAVNNQLNGNISGSYVPYTGANSNVNLGTHSLSTTGYVNAGNFNVSSNGAYLYDGVQALKLAKGTGTVYWNTLVGKAIGNAAANYQTAIGYNAGSLSSGNYSTSVGSFAGNNGYGNYQTSVGYFAGAQNHGLHSISMGYLSGYEGYGDYSINLGYESGYQGFGGTRSIAIGYQAGYINGGHDGIFLGYQAGKNNNLNNQFIVQQANVNLVPLIQGDFATGNINISGKISGLANGTLSNDAVNYQQLQAVSSNAGANVNSSINGTANHFAKFDATGHAVVDTKVTEDSSGNVNVSGNISVQSKITIGNMQIYKDTKGDMVFRA